MTRSQDNRLTNSVVQQQSIGQTGKRVVLGQMDHLQRHSPGGSHIADDDYRSGSSPVPVVDRSDRAFDRDFEAVAPTEDAVRRQVQDLVLPNGLVYRIRSSFSASGVVDSENFDH